MRSKFEQPEIAGSKGEHVVKTLFVAFALALAVFGVAVALVVIIDLFR